MQNFLLKIFKNKANNCHLLASVSCNDACVYLIIWFSSSVVFLLDVSPIDPSFQGLGSVRGLRSEADGTTEPHRDDCSPALRRDQACIFVSRKSSAICLLNQTVLSVERPQPFGRTIYPFFSRGPERCSLFIKLV